MRFLGIRDFRSNSAEVWKNLEKEKEIIITSNGKPIAILSSISETNLEESLKAFRQFRAMNAIDDIQNSSVIKRKNSICLNEIESEIEKVRKRNKS